jgi:methylphosphotriester-DNA--protein-cysteine methyltransferase
MINHSELQAAGFTGKRRLASLINNNMITFAGNRQLKIYGRFSCFSGKRMKTANRVFFMNEQEAIEKGYRPCGHCLRSKYLLWKEIK